MKILRYPDKRLETPAAQIIIFTAGLRHFGQKMLSVMRENGGAGLAANQIGSKLNMFVMNTSDWPDQVIVNPKWSVLDSSRKVKTIEGCLSFPGWLVPVERYDKIYAEWQTPRGKYMYALMGGFPAQVFQHETDHLRGITMLRYLNEAQQQTLKNFYKE